MLLYSGLKPAIMVITVLRDMKHVLNLSQSFATVGTMYMYCIYIGFNRLQLVCNYNVPCWSFPNNLGSK